MAIARIFFHGEETHIGCKIEHQLVKHCGLSSPASGLPQRSTLCAGSLIFVRTRVAVCPVIQHSDLPNVPTYKVNASPSLLPTTTSNDVARRHLVRNLSPLTVFDVSEVATTLVELLGKKAQDHCSRMVKQTQKDALEKAAAAPTGCSHPAGLSADRTQRLVDLGAFTSSRSSPVVETNPSASAYTRS
ncbi:uncharacterized protein BXZ73DRAFT_85504 [Epithele typhae]|uniref:uncharacterized protein n=1 Tax=Epithele typhae TaxID=378194 RepID=UPI0020083CC8|nr:uncharacterized protein BXZ73DRAFT_85504 [Epithele typhae]KAH9903886.1 hypothetical protein BXZ73DRAFT_85504 [Epithele typhae]